MVPLAESAADALAGEASVEVLDIRTLKPLDEASLLASVAKTGRAVLIQEAPRTCGYAAEIAAILAEKAIYDLRGPVLRVTGYDVPYPTGRSRMRTCPRSSASSMRPGACSRRDHGRLARARRAAHGARPGRGGRNSLRARGTQLGVAYELRYELEPEVLRVEVVGERSLDVELGGLDCFDLGNSPLFNSLPVLRDGLLYRRRGARLRHALGLGARARDPRGAAALRAARRRDGPVQLGGLRRRDQVRRGRARRPLRGLAERLA